MHAAVVYMSSRQAVGAKIYTKIALIKQTLVWPETTFEVISCPAHRPGPLLSILDICHQLPLKPHTFPLQAHCVRARACVCVFVCAWLYRLSRRRIPVLLKGAGGSA